MAQKFRPYLSAAELKHIILLLRKDASAASLSIAKSLEVFEFKITNDINRPSYIPTPLPTIAQRLELGEGAPVSETAEDKRLRAFAKFTANPSFCSSHEISLAQTYRYTHKLMSTEERNHYEKELFGSPPEPEEPVLS